MKQTMTLDELRIVVNLERFVPHRADPEDYEKLLETANWLISIKFTYAEVGSYMNCMEEVNPGLNEDYAIQHMAEIMNAVKARTKED